MKKEPTYLNTRLKALWHLLRTKEFILMAYNSVEATLVPNSAMYELFIEIKEFNKRKEEEYARRLQEASSFGRQDRIAEGGAQVTE